MSLKKILHQQALTAIVNKRFDIAAENWLEWYCLPENTEELQNLYSSLLPLAQESKDVYLYSILGFFLLDHSDILNIDREAALVLCVDFSHQGLKIDQDNYHCIRNAGSANFWLGNNKEAKYYYSLANVINASPVLQIRLFQIENSEIEIKDYSLLEITSDHQSAMECYNAAVELSALLNNDKTIDEFERVRLMYIRRHLYITAYTLYRNCIESHEQDKLNCDERTFAMCCNNLSQLLGAEGDFQKAIDVANEGIKRYPFMTIELTRFYHYVDTDSDENVIKEGRRLIDEYGDELDDISFMEVINGLCNSSMVLKNYKNALNWAEIGIQFYHSLDVTDPLTQNEHIIRCFTNFFINKAKSEEKLEIVKNTDCEAEDVDSVLEKIPDNPSILISRGNTFMEQGDFEASAKCYDAAIFFAKEKNVTRSIQVAFYNKGYLQEVFFNNSAEALQSFEQSISYNNNDFWCYYWATKSAYRIMDNQKTVYLGESALNLVKDEESGVAEDVIAELYEHIGTSYLDLKNYKEALKFLKKSVDLSQNINAEANLKIVKSFI